MLAEKIEAAFGPADEHLERDVGWMRRVGPVTTLAGRLGALPLSNGLG
jgi:hypothetical protein